MKKKVFSFLFLSAVVLPSIFSCNSIKADKVTIKGADAIEIGETTSFIGEVLPKEATSKKINWSSSDPSVAYVDQDGNVTGIKDGKVTITGSSDDKGGAHASQTLRIGNYIEKHVEDVSLSCETNEIEEGNSYALKVDITPSDADNKNVTFKSSNQDVISVSSNGIVKGELYTGTLNDDVVISATSEDGEKVGNLTLHSKKSTLSEITIKGFSQPKCKINYLNHVNSLDDQIKSDDINRDNSKQYLTGNFFKDSEENLIYKVGCLNAFKYKCGISVGKSKWEDHVENNPYQEVISLMYKNNLSESDWKDGFSFLQSKNIKNNEFIFNTSAVDKFFQLTVKPNSQYQGVTDDMKSTFTFKVVNGYNVYDLEGFSQIDNWSIVNAKKVLGENHPIFVNNEFVDNWGEYKTKHGISLDNSNINCIVMHDDVSISTKDLSKYITWTRKETDDYINGVRDPVYKERFDNFVEIKANIHQDDWAKLPLDAQRAKCHYLLEGSLKDNCNIFYRNCMNNNFVLEGNFFSLDASKIKPICSFDKQSLDGYQSIATHTSSLISSANVDSHGKSSQFGETLFDEFRPYCCGGYNEKYKPTINNLHVRGNSIKDDTHDEGMGGLNFYLSNGNFEINNSVCHEFSNTINTLGPISFNKSVDINKCRFFDNFASFVRSFCGKGIHINDSFMKDAGGHAICIFEQVDEEKQSTYEVTIDVKNSYLECFVSGNEIYNKNNLGHVIIGIFSSVGLNAFEKYKSIRFKYPCDHRSFIKVEDGVAKVNYILYHNFSPWLNPTAPGKSRFTVDGQDIMNLETESKSGSIIDIYNNLDITARTVASLTFKSSKGGHARLPILSIAEANDLEMYDEHINPESYYSSDHTTLISNYVANQAQFDKDIPTVGNNLANLFSGDYCTSYLKPLMDYMCAVVLGYK